LISLTSEASRLGELMVNDPELRQKEMELGFRVLDSSSATSSGQLRTFLRQQGIQPPVLEGNDTKTYLPRLSLLGTDDQRRR